MRRLPLAICALAVGLASFAAASARAQSCAALDAELATLQRQGGNDPQRYERAFREQARALERTEDRARDAGCFGGGFFFFRDEPDRACRTLLPKLREMQDNLAQLDNLRRRGGGNVFARRIRTVKRMMSVRDCGNDMAAPGQDPIPAFSSRGTFRTLCVRTCDGYYFPISFSTTPDRFIEDARTCSAMCPGTEAKLFSHPNPGGTPEDMVGIDGQPYATLPTAFQYRTAISDACTCKQAGGTTFASANPGIGLDLGAPVEDATAPLPQRRPEPGADPETLANRAGGLGAGGEPAPATGPLVGGPTPAGPQMRTVGPSFGSSPEQAGIVLTPVPN